ncbi:hypothetical protein H8E77_29340 [bacterium]|nr:hypothetical protein [bacterium]
MRWWEHTWAQIIMLTGSLASIIAFIGVFIFRKTIVSQINSAFVALWKHLTSQFSVPYWLLYLLIVFACLGLILLFRRRQIRGIKIVNINDEKNPYIAQNGNFMDLAFRGVIWNSGNQSGVISEITEVLLIIRKGRSKLELRNTQEIKLNYDGKNDVSLRYNPITVAKGGRISFNFRVKTDLTIDKIKKLSESKDYHSVLLNPDRIEFTLKYKVLEREVVKSKEINIEVVDKPNITDYLKKFR